MADMISVVVTMHPRALASIEEFWQLADLPSLRVDEANRHIVVVMPPLGTLDQARRLLTAYLNAARRDPADAGDALAPFTEDAVDELWAHSTKKPRDLLRKAHKMVTYAAEENLDIIDAEAVNSHLMLLTAGDDEVITDNAADRQHRGTRLLQRVVVVSFTAFMRDLFCLANAHLAAGEAGDGRAFERRVERHLAATGVRPVEVFSGVRSLGSQSLSGLYHQIDATGTMRDAVVIGEWKAYRGAIPKNDLLRFKAATDDYWLRQHQYAMAPVIRVFGGTGYASQALRRYAAVLGHLSHHDRPVARPPVGFRHHRVARWGARSARPPVPRLADEAAGHGLHSAVRRELVYPQAAVRCDDRPLPHDPQPVVRRVVAALRRSHWQLRPVGRRHDPVG